MHTNLTNELAKRGYFKYLSEAQGWTEKTIVQVEVGISKFDDFLIGADYRVFDSDLAIEFKEHLRTYVSPKTEKLLSPYMIVKTLHAVKNLLRWLCGQKGYRSRLKASEIEYLNPKTTEEHTSQATTWISRPTLDELYCVIRAMPFDTTEQRRDRAAIALTVLTGVRDGALITLKVGHLVMPERLLNQDPRDVATKNSKHILSWFFPVASDIEEIVEAWHRELVADFFFRPEDPLFPVTRQIQNSSGLFENNGIRREHWTYANPFRDAYRSACEKVGLTYRKPHHIRDALVGHGMRICRTPEEFKAWSQNLGHESVLTTFGSYGEITPRQQAQLMAGLRDIVPTAADSPIIGGLRIAARAAGFDLVPIRSPDPQAHP